MCWGGKRRKEWNLWMKLKSRLPLYIEKLNSFILVFIFQKSIQKFWCGLHFFNVVRDKVSIFHSTFSVFALKLWTFHTNYGQIIDISCITWEIWASMYLFWLTNVHTNVPMLKVNTPKIQIYSPHGTQSPHAWEYFSFLLFKWWMHN